MSITPLAPLTRPTQEIRDTDEWGSGAYGAPRGDRTHRGIDIVTTHGQVITAPFDGIMVRRADPYEDDPAYTGCLLRRESDGLEIKLFYIENLSTGAVSEGQKIGTAQDIAQKYPGITNHIHLEVWLNGAPVDPTPYLQPTT